MEKSKATMAIICVRLRSAQGDLSAVPSTFTLVYIPFKLFLRLKKSNDWLKQHINSTYLHSQIILILTKSLLS